MAGCPIAALEKQRKFIDPTIQNVKRRHRGRKTFLCVYAVYGRKK